MCSVRYTCNRLFSHFITNKLLFYFNVVYCDDLNLDLLYNHRLNNLWLQRGMRNQLLTSSLSRYPQFSLLLNDRHVNFCPGRILSVPELCWKTHPSWVPTPFHARLSEIDYFQPPLKGSTSKSILEFVHTSWHTSQCPQGSLGAP